MNRQKVLITVIPVILVMLTLFFTRNATEETLDIIINPEVAPFRVTVTTTGELRAQRTSPIEGPAMARRSRGIRNLTILRLVPEGTVVEEGDFVAELDKGDIQSQIQDLALTLEQYANNIEQVKLDCTMTLANARNELINLDYTVQEKKLFMEQSRFEAPSIVRQTEIDAEKAARALNQAIENYDTRVQLSVAKMKEAENNMARRSRDMEQYRALMRQFTVRAPAKGMVIYYRERNGTKRTEGSSVSAFDPVIATLPDLSTMESVTFISEVDIQKIHVGQGVEIGIDADPSKQLTGRITHVANIGEQRPNSDSKVFEVVIMVEGSDLDLRPAMTTSNTIIVAETDDVLYIPLEGLQSLDSLSYVYKKSAGSTVRQEVVPGLINENAVVIEAGLDVSDEIYLSLPENSNELPLRRLQ